MIIDFNSPQAPTNYEAKICIIGSGIIGLTIVSEFLNQAAADVLLIESGDFDINNELKSLDQVINTGEVDSGVEGSRARMFGGTSVLWGGQVLPFSELDFAHREWINHAGWPIGLKDLENYYQRAATLLSLDNADFSENIWRKNSSIKNQLNDDFFDLTFSKWSPKPNLGVEFKKDVQKSKHVRLLTNASVMEIDLNDSSNAAKTVTLKSLSGNHAQVKAGIFILACGGIDNARILLNSNKTCVNGIGNNYGVVGRYYQDHIGLYGARLIPKNFKAFEDLFSNFLQGKHKYLPKLVLSQAQQIKNQLLNVNASISIQVHDDSPINNLKNFYSTLRSQGLNISTVKSLINAARTPVELVRIINSYYLKHRKHFPKDAGYFLIANCETEPNEDSYIKLSKEQDAIGMPKAQVNWKISDLSKKTLLGFYQLVDAELDRLQIAEVKIRPELLEPSDQWKQRCYSLYHHIGATRMSTDQKMGVVDSDCRVYGIENLYIAGTSVFPTGGCANPTFTAMALSLRLTDHIKRNTTT